jgi:hypothetical protein
MILRVIYKLAEYVARMVLKPYAYKRLARIPEHVSGFEGMRQRKEGTKIDLIKARSSTRVYKLWTELANSGVFNP